MEENITLEYLYEKLYRIRRAEEKIIEIYPSDKIKSPVHLSIGQEFISVAICESLNKHDVVFGTYRGHALYLAKGGDLKEFFAELYGKETGCCGGRGGSMHLLSTEVGLMGTSAIVATTIPEAVGYAYAMKIKEKNIKTVVFFGDGAIEEGVFYESLNFAAIHNLNIIFVCENNGKAVYADTSKRNRKGIHENVKPFCIRNVYLDRKHFSEINYNLKDVCNFLSKVFLINTPLFITIECNRLMEHVGTGLDDDYKNDIRLEEFKKNDIILNIRKNIQNVQLIEDKVNKEIEEAIQFAEQSEFSNKKELLRNVW